ncbi:MAG: nucleoside triphosphate pyrophosphatase [Pseudomonadota bacterium]
MTDIILASGSASRRAILTGAGIPFTVQRPNVDEDALKPTFSDLTPSELALALAREKALSISASGAIVIGADQVMEFDGRPFDKPKSREELKDRLRMMSALPHHLRGGVVLVRDGEILAAIQETSTLTMRALTDDAINTYVDALTDDIALGTVGGYALEGLGPRIFSKVEGDFFAILGLPLFPVMDVLRREGALPW